MWFLVVKTKLCNIVCEKKNPCKSTFLEVWLCTLFEIVSITHFKVIISGPQQFVQFVQY